MNLMRRSALWVGVSLMILLVVSPTQARASTSAPNSTQGASAPMAITRAQAEQLKAVQAELNQEGYVTSRAYIDANGQIAILYGRIGKVILHDGSTPLPALKRYIFNMVLEGQVLRLQQLQAIVALYNKMSSNQVHMDIKAGKEPNTSDIIITNSYHPVWSLGAGYRYFDDRHWAYVTGSYQQPLGLNDVLTSALYFNDHNLYWNVSYQVKDVALTMNSQYQNQWLSQGTQRTPFNQSALKVRYALSYGTQIGVGAQSALNWNAKLEYLHDKQWVNVGTLNLKTRHVYYWNAYLTGDWWNVVSQDKSGYFYLEFKPQLKMGLIQGTSNGVYTNLSLDTALHTKSVYSKHIAFLNDFSVKLFATVKPNSKAATDPEYQYSDSDYGYSGDKVVVVRNNFRLLMQGDRWSVVPSFELNTAWQQKWVKGAGIGLSVSYKYLVGSVQAGAATNGARFINASIGIQYPGE